MNAGIRPLSRRDDGKHCVVSMPRILRGEETFRRLLMPTD